VEAVAYRRPLAARPTAVLLSRPLRALSQ